MMKHGGVKKWKIKEWLRDVEDEMRMSNIHLIGVPGK